MRDWTVLFSSSEGSGIYTAESGTRTSRIKKAALAGKLDYAEVDLKAVEGKKALLEKLAGTLDFPDYFGMNWDALNDCLTDMGWRPAPGYVIVLKKFEALTEKYPDDAGTVKDIFAAASLHWKQKAVPFYIILS